jgi:hypothetical protein
MITAEQLENMIVSYLDGICPDELNWLRKWNLEGRPELFVAENKLSGPPPENKAFQYMAKVEPGFYNFQGTIEEYHEDRKQN